MDTADKGPVSNVSHYIHVYMILGFNYGHNEYRLFKIVHVLVTTKTRTSLRTIYKFTSIKYHPYHKVLPNAEDSHRIQPLNAGKSTKSMGESIPMYRGVD